MKTPPTPKRVEAAIKHDWQIPASLVAYLKLTSNIPEANNVAIHRDHMTAHVVNLDPANTTFRVWVRLKGSPMYQTTVNNIQVRHGSGESADKLAVRTAIEKWFPTCTIAALNWVETED